MVLPIPIRCMYFLVAYHLRTPELNIFDLEQLWDGWPFGKFFEKREWGQSVTSQKFNYKNSEILLLEIIVMIP